LCAGNNALTSNTNNYKKGQVVMIIQHKTLREARHTHRHLKEAGIRVPEPHRGAARGSKHWWLVDAPDTDANILWRLLARIVDLEQNFHIAEWKMRDVEQATLKEKAEWNTSALCVVNALMPFLPEHVCTALTASGKAA
jgi:hypothetical protein